jgi:hypothetical protein
MMMMLKDGFCYVIVNSDLVLEEIVNPLIAVVMAGAAAMTMSDVKSVVHIPSLKRNIGFIPSNL